MNILLGLTWLIIGAVLLHKGIKNEQPIAGLGFILLCAGILTITI